MSATTPPLPPPLYLILYMPAAETNTAKKLQKLAINPAGYRQLLAFEVGEQPWRGRRGGQAASFPSAS
jgi:hypothetical protein